MSSDAGERQAQQTQQRIKDFLGLLPLTLEIAGLTPTQVITAATKRGGEFLRAKDLGTLEVGKWADMIVLGSNPMANIRNMRSIEAVYVAGKKIAP